MNVDTLPPVFEVFQLHMVCALRAWVSWTICQFIPLSHYHPELVFHRPKLSSGVSCNDGRQACSCKVMALKCCITDYHLNSQCCTSAWTCPTSTPPLLHTGTQFNHFLGRNEWNSRVSAGGLVTLVSFVCQQACLFFPESVRFSGLLNQTDRFVPCPASVLLYGQLRSLYGGAETLVYPSFFELMVITLEVWLQSFNFPIKKLLHLVISLICQFCDTNMCCGVSAVTEQPNRPDTNLKHPQVFTCPG